MSVTYQFKGFLFDLDGTLLDTAPDLLAALNNLLLKHGKQVLALKDIQSIISDGSEGLIRKGLGLDKSSKFLDAAKSQFLNYYQHNLIKETTVYDGIEEILRSIENSDRPWGIVTNKPSRFTIPILKHFGWHRRASCVICGDSLGKNKPSPVPLIEGAKLMNLLTEDCVYIGDALCDVEAAKAARMFSITAGYGYVPDEDWKKSWMSDGVIQTPLDLGKWLI